MPRRLPHTDADGVRSFGMNVFLASSTMMFGALLVLYALLRTGAAHWPRPGGMGLAVAATCAIATSSLVLHRGVQAVLAARQRLLSGRLLATIALGLAFLAIEIVLWRSLWRAGYVAGNPHAGTFYVLTIFHFVHVAVAIGLLSWLVPGALRGRYHANDHVRVRLVARFWHFLGFNWMLLFCSLFLI